MPERPVPSGDSSYSGKEAGEVVDLWKGVPVRSNGDDFVASHGRHFAACGYYYGQKWQCVEFAKRFAKDVLNHEMPDVMGHAAHFFDPELDHGVLNPARDLVQFQNGREDLPRPDDLMVWTQGGYGHIAVVTRVEEDSSGGGQLGWVEVVQQNVLRGTRMRLPITRTPEGGFEVGEAGWLPAGWLRGREG